MKKIMALIIFLLSFSSVYAEDNIKVYINSVPVYFDTNPIMINGRTMVPVRDIFEALGAEVYWNGETRTVTAAKDGSNVSMTIGNNKILVNDLIIIMDTTPVIMNNRTLIPARFAAEAFECSVEWDAQTRTVDIISSKKPDTQYFKIWQNNFMSVLYPADWFLDESFPGTLFIDNQSDSFQTLGMGMISISQMDFMNSSFSDTVSARYDYLISDCGLTISEFKNTTVNGCAATLFKYTDKDGDFVTSYLIAGNTKAFFIEFISDSPGVFDNIYNTVLSSFTLL